VTPLDFALASVLWGLGAFVYGWLAVEYAARGVNRRGDW
jgi:hypothetical protein